MAAPNLDEGLTTAIRNRTRKLADNVTDNNALLAKMKMSGTMKTVDGGESILQELEYDENSTYKRYSGYEVLDISPSEVFTAAEFGWKQVAVAVLISGLEMLKNSGRSKMTRSPGIADQKRREDDVEQRLWRSLLRRNSRIRASRSTDSTPSSRRPRTPAPLAGSTARRGSSGARRF